MGIQIALHHRTEYRYDKKISLGPQVIQLRPAPYCRTPILNYSLDITPAQHNLKWQFDPYSNYLARVLFPEKTNELLIDVRLVADLAPINPFDFFLEPGFEEFPFVYSPDLSKDLEPYRSADQAGPLLRSFLGEYRAARLRNGAKVGTVTLLLELNRKVRDDIAYVTRLEPGVQSCEKTLELRSGSCRDSAWLLVQVLRQFGIAARFVSGYLVQLATEDRATDLADLHAWAEAYLPGAGWIGLDPTSGLLAAEGHIPLATTPSAWKAAPIGGTMEPAGVDFSFAMSVRRLNQAPTLNQQPISDMDWRLIEQVAHKVDRELEAHDARLTMGGEPTFVGIDEPESPQWNIDALGPIKRTRGLDLIRCIRDEKAPGALLHYGQGKWYPGEPLPRWALSCYWRIDGVPVWSNPNLIAREDEVAGYTAADALRFGEALTRRLQVSMENLLPVYNIPFYEAENQKDQPAGYILPIRRRQPEGQIRWSSQLWFSRPDRLVLTAGDSPIGFRIPTETMPWVAPDEITYEHDDAPFADQARLPASPPRRMDLFDQIPAADDLPPLSRTAETATVLIRTAVCLEARDGRLHVFLPFSSELADYLDMVAAVEDTAEYLKVQIWVEGYAPPQDSRLRFFSMTPDPGVLEVNLPPARNWDELQSMNALLFKLAGENRLVAEKFNYDGGHVSTGGGSHIVIGGATLLDSPLLRRPDLLRSMVAFWQNHPSLSYLFSGIYVGPTSQYPRVDEARLDALYELEIAFRNLPLEDCSPWILDGIFRNLLADVTGNTHRAEFCIDKLYPPEGLGLQLGLLELRAFEMPPHLRMSLLQSLLVRALVCAFWKTPFEGGLVRWGSALHDRFMLPHFVQRDLSDVLAYLRAGGFAFEQEWFAAHSEFRFARIGTVASADPAEKVELELRHALEPWNVLAEETASGRTVRSVDSSMERMQVRVSGSAVDGRYIVTCNGRRVPLTPTGEPGVALAGIRYRGRRLSATLHPTIPVHAPLTFELIDSWNGSWNSSGNANSNGNSVPGWTGRSVGRCIYHVAAPDGRVYPSRPASAAEAEERRSERFEHLDPALGPVDIPELETNPIFPMTLDFRLPTAQEPIALKHNGPVPPMVASSPGHAQETSP